MQRALSLNSSPAASIPLRFLFSAPLFMLLAALLLLWSGPTALASRWTPQALAITHLLTLGVLAHVMIGALMQILPVATGASMLAPRLTATAVHLALCIGTVFIALAFLAGASWMFATAISLLGSSLLWLLIACAGGLWRDRHQVTKGAGEILAGVRLALAALLATMLLGLMLGGHLAAGQPVPRLYTNLHAAWGLLGWIGLLVIAISHQLIPMFQVTELYPHGMSRWLARLIFAPLLIYSVNVFVLQNMLLSLSAGLLLCAAFLAYACTTLKLLHQRKRPEPDTTTLFWRTALISLAACIVLWLAQTLDGRDHSLTLGVLYLVGFAWSAVNGMLYKIVPFLTWFHAQRGLAIALPFIPKVRQIIPDGQARKQYRVHLAALVLLLAASIWPWLFTRAAALALTASAIWLLALLISALLSLWQTKKKIRAALSPDNAAAQVGPES